MELVDVVSYDFPPNFILSASLSGSLLSLADLLGPSTAEAGGDGGDGGDVGGAGVSGEARDGMSGDWSCC